MTTKRLVIVLAMHRSGSSAITRGLSTLGLDLGDHLMPPVKGNNEKGFFEDLDIARFNEALLFEAKSDWHRLSRLDPALLTGPAFSNRRREAAKLLSSKMDAFENFAFKDPRTAVLLPFWQCIFEDLEVEEHYVITVRNPLATAASLEARDKFPIRKGVYLWAKHFLEAVQRTEDRQRIFVSYDRLMDNPLAELTRLADALNYPSPDPESEEFQEFQETFLDEGLRHNVVGAKELSRSGIAPDFLVELSDMARDWTLAKAGEIIAPPTEFWNRVSERYDEIAPLMELADEFDTERETAQAGIDAAAGRAENAEAEAADARARADEATQRQAELSAELTALKTANDELSASARDAKSELDALKRSNAQEVGLLQEAKQKLTDEIGRTRKERNQFETSADALRQELTENGLRLDALAARNATLENDLASEQEQTELIAKDISLIAAECDRHLRELRQVRQELEEERKASREKTTQLSEDRSNAIRNYNDRLLENVDLRDRITALERSNKQSRADFLLAGAALREVRNSTSWRLTAPLRGSAYVIRHPISGSKKVVSTLARGVWHAIPISPGGRGRLAGVLFTLAPFAFFWTPQYKVWQTEKMAKRNSTIIS